MRSSSSSSAAAASAVSGAAASAGVVRSLEKALPASGAGSAARCASPDSFGAVPLAALRSNEASENAALTAALSELARVLERSEDYFGTVQAAGSLVLVELWHRSAFTAEHCAVRGADGKSRTLTYDVKQRRIVGTKIW